MEKPKRSLLKSRLFRRIIIILLILNPQFFLGLTIDLVPLCKAVAPIISKWGTKAIAGVTASTYFLGPRTQKENLQFLKDHLPVGSVVRRSECKVKIHDLPWNFIIQQMVKK